MSMKKVRILLIICLILILLSLTKYAFSIAEAVGLSDANAVHTYKINKKLYLLNIEHRTNDDTLLWISKKKLFWNISIVEQDEMTYKTIDHIVVKRRSGMEYIEIYTYCWGQGDINIFLSKDNKFQKIYTYSQGVLYGPFHNNGQIISYKNGCLEVDEKEGLDDYPELEFSGILVEYGYGNSDENSLTPYREYSIREVYTWDKKKECYAIKESKKKQINEYPIQYTYEEFINLSING